MKWILKKNKMNLKLMSETLGISEVFAAVLSNRAIDNKNSAISFITPKMENLHNTFLMHHIEKAIKIIVDSVKENEKIAVYGDYDVDGVMSSVILYKTLKQFGADVIHYIPNREKEGYGLNVSAVHYLKSIGVDVIFTCDNGISSVEEIEEAKKLGMKVIILDHHEPRFIVNHEGDRIDIIPEADAVIDPKQKICEYPFKSLCAGGISYKFAVAFCEYVDMDIDQDELLIFAAIATVCDIVDLVDENRIIVKNALEKFPSANNKGLLALLAVCDINITEVTSYTIGFRIGPCINAAGRLEAARISVLMFLEEDEVIAKQYAEKLFELNNERKNLTTYAVERIINKVENDDLKNNKVIVAYDEEIHESIAGIVAGKVKEKYYKPTIILTKSDKFVKGSGRSIEGYNIFENLLECVSLLEKFGGHSMAAGLTMKYENIETLNHLLNEKCTLTDEDYIVKLKVEKIILLDDITMDVANEIKLLEPFGKANESPLFASQHVQLVKLDFIGSLKRILKLTFKSENNNFISGICFDGYDLFSKIMWEHFRDDFENIMQGVLINSKIVLDIVYYMDINVYNGNKYLQLKLKDFRISS